MPANNLVSLAGSFLILFSLSACSIGWIDRAGGRHVLGLVYASVSQSDDARVAGNIVEVSTIGASLLSDSQATSLTLGYSRTTTADFRDNAIARGPFDRVVADDAPETRIRAGE